MQVSKFIPEKKIEVIFSNSVVFNWGVFTSWKTGLGLILIYTGFPGDASGKELTCQCRRCKRLRLDP